MLLNAPDPIHRPAPKSNTAGGFRRALLLDGDRFERTTARLRAAVEKLWPVQVERLVAASALATDPEWLANAMGVMGGVT